MTDSTGPEAGRSSRWESKSWEISDGDKSVSLQSAEERCKAEKCSADAAENELAVLRAEAALLEAEVSIWARPYVTTKAILATVVMGLVAVVAVRLGMNY